MFVQKRMWNQCRPRWQRAFSARGMCFHAEAAGCTNTSNFMTKASSSLVSWTGRVLGWDRDSGMIKNCTVEPLSLTFFAPSVLNSLPASLWNLPVLSGFKAQTVTQSQMKPFHKLSSGQTHSASTNYVYNKFDDACPWIVHCLCGYIVWKELWYYVFNLCFYKSHLFVFLSLTL